MKPRPNRWLPALLLLGAASAASLAPDAFLLDRAAVEGGELWRWWTGHLVHHTAAHFAFDVGVALLLLLFVRSPLAWLVLPPVVGCVVLLARPDLATYAGLSGVLHGLTVLAGFDLAREGRGLERWIAGGLLAGVVAKAIVEAILGVSVFSGGFDMGAETVFLSHLAGVAGGLVLVGLAVRAGRSRPGGARSPARPARPTPCLRHAGLRPPGRRAGSRRCA